MLIVFLVILAGLGPALPAAAEVELIRDAWGVPHAFAEREEDGFYAIGWAAAEDRLVQMEIFRRRGRGRLAEVLGAGAIQSDERFRLAGMSEYCDEAAARLPETHRSYLEGYAAGVNAWVAEHREQVARRLLPLGLRTLPAWTAGDCICTWKAVAEVFDNWVQPGAVDEYDRFRNRARTVGREAALAERWTVIDDGGAIVPESEMARFSEWYDYLKSLPRTPGLERRSLSEDQLKFSHAWAVSGARSVSGAPVLQSDPQVAVSNPPLWYEFHISAGRYNVRGIGVAGSPAMLVGFNDSMAWGASALGVGSTVTFMETLTPDRRRYLYKGEEFEFERRREVIEVKGREPYVIEARRTRHGFVANVNSAVPLSGEVAVTHVKEMEDRGTSLVGLLEMMGAGDWEAFRDAMQWYYSPGINVVFADRHGNLGYQTLVHLPRTAWTPRMALEGWTGDHEIKERIPFIEMPFMLNPEAGYISHANNLPVGSWYPHDLGTGVGDTARSLRLRQLLGDRQLHDVESFEREIHRDDVHAGVSALLPVARRLVEEMDLQEPKVLALLRVLEGWNGRYEAGTPAYPAARALSRELVSGIRRASISGKVGGGEGGVMHLARRLEEQFGGGTGVPTDQMVRDYLLPWLGRAAEAYVRDPRPAPVTHVMPWQANGPMSITSLNPEFDLESPPLSTGEIGTIWSQPGNSYTQIVDLADPDSARALLPPGISEDPESPFHRNQMEIWVRGETRPAPLSREKVEEGASSRLTLTRPRSDVIQR
jgi:penicillin amidase